MTIRLCERNKNSQKMQSGLAKKQLKKAGADLGFSRGWGRIFKKFSRNLTTYF